MREIKFRGRRLDNGKWVTGDLLHGKNGKVLINAGTKMFTTYAEVDPDTVGQFTGLYDKNGKEIYEGDIILYGGSIQHEVVFRHGAFGYLLYGGEFISYAGNTNFTFNPLNRSKEHEVIGNIYDNPELTKAPKQ